MVKALDKMDKDELEAELAEANTRVKALQKALSEYDDRRKAEVRAELEAQAKAAGYSLNDLLGGGTKRTRGSKGTVVKGQPKFRHPENPSVTWTGKGRQPVWYKEHVEKAGNDDALAI